MKSTRPDDPTLPSLLHEWEREPEAWPSREQYAVDHPGRTPVQAMAAAIMRLTGEQDQLGLSGPSPAERIGLFDRLWSEFWAEHRSRAVLLAFLPMALAVASFYAILPIRVAVMALELPLVALGLGVILISWIAFRWLVQLNILIALTSWAVGLVCVGLGLAAGQISALVPLPPVEWRAEGVVGFEVRALSPGREGRAVATIEITTSDGVVEGKQALVGSRARLFLSEETVAFAPQVGASYHGTLRFWSPPRSETPWGFDARWRAYFEGTRYYAAPAKGTTLVEQLRPPASAGLGAMVQKRASLIWSRLQGRAARRYLAGMGSSTGPVAAAMLTGERGAIPGAVQQNIRKSGLAHLLAISGLHVGMVFGTLFMMTRGLGLLHPAATDRGRVRPIAVLVALLLTAGFVLLVGASIPTIRAFAMLSVVGLGLLLGRRAFSPASIAVAAFVAMAVEPSSLMAPSFQLSFTAVFVLICTFDALNRHWRARDTTARMELERILLEHQTHKTGVTRADLLLERRSNRAARGPVADAVRKVVRGLFAIALSSVLVSVVTLPLTLYHFQDGTLVGIVSNLVAVPWASFVVMPLGVLSLASMPLGLDGFILPLLDRAVAGLLWIANITAPLAERGSFWGPVPRPPVSQFLILMSIFLGFGLLGRLRLLALPPLVLGLGLMITSAVPVALITGQGIVALVEEQPAGSELVAYSRWTRQEDLGDFQQQALRALEAGGQDRWLCDAGGCQVSAADGYSIALPLNGSSLDQDCARADLVIVLPALSAASFRCSNASVLPLSELDGQWPMALWLSDRAPLFAASRVHLRASQAADTATPWR